MQLQPPSAEIPERWHRLFEASPSSNPFHSPDWVNAWCETSRNSGRLQFLVDEDFLWPVCKVGNKLIPAAARRSDETTPLTSGDVQGAVSKAIARFPNLEVSSVPDGLIDFSGRMPLAAGEHYVLDLPESLDSHLNTLSKSLRADVRRGFRNSDLCFRWNIGDNFFDNLFALHAKRWHKRLMPGSFFSRQVRQFHRQFGANEVAQTLQLEHQGRAIGCLYGMKAGDRFFFYQCGFDPECAKLCPGSMMIAEAINRAIQLGLKRFDFLRGTEPYKKRWNPTCTEKYVRIPSARSATQLRIEVAKHMSEQRLRAWLEGHAK